MVYFGVLACQCMEELFHLHGVISIIVIMVVVIIVVVIVVVIIVVVIVH